MLKYNKSRAQISKLSLVGTIDSNSFDTYSKFRAKRFPISMLRSAIIIRARVELTDHPEFFNVIHTDVEISVKNAVRIVVGGACKIRDDHLVDKSSGFP